MDHSPVRGRLSYSAGETLLTAWEAQRLAPGDIVLTSRQAGYPGFILLNNLPVGLAEVVVLDDTLGVRVVDTDFRPHFDVDPGRRDTVGEAVPTIVELGSFEVDLGQARWVRQSILNLGVPCDGPSNAVLVFAGIPLARGLVVVVGEYLGLRVVERLRDWPATGPVRQSGNLADRATAALAKVYDFRRPDRFSVTQIRRLEEIHRLFQRHLESSLPAAADLLGGNTEALLVDQCTLGEAREALAAQGLELAAAWEQDAPRRGRPSSRPLLEPEYFEAEDCPRPASASTRAALVSWLKPQGFSGRCPIYWHARRPWSEGELTVCAEALRSGWKKYLDFSLGEGPPGEEPAADPADSEMVILVLLRTGVPLRTEMALVYPYLVLEPFLNLLGS